MELETRTSDQQTRKYGMALKMGLINYNGAEPPAGANDPFIDCFSRNVLVTMQIKRIPYRRLPVIAAFIVFMCAGCTTGAFASFITIKGPVSSQISDFSLRNTEWHLVSYDNENSITPVEAGSAITLKFNKDDTISGSGGINLYFGSYKQTGSRVTFGTIGSTEMAGPEPLMDQESSYFRLLDSVRSFHFADSTLELSDVTGRVLLTFNADNSGNTDNSAGKNPVNVLPGTEWQLSSYSYDNAVVSVPDISTITLKFDGAGNLSGFGGVNSYFGSYNLEAGTFSIGLLGSTKMAGPGPLMALETVYFNLLGSATGARVNGNILSMTDNSGNIILTFQQKNTVSQGRYTALLAPGASNSVSEPISGGLTAKAIKDRLHKTYNRSGSTAGSQTKLLYPGNGIVTIPSTGNKNTPSTMPRLNDSIIPPVTYPGGPLY
ncbi:MAG: META domain-containing protein [Methanoregulaceae archaeon]|nr:META domain-containing protein [Methanoregulaceae archaeon]